MARRTPTARRATTLAVALGFGAIIFDGYDLIVYGSAVPALLAYKEWGLTPADVGRLGSLALAGMLVGAILSGWLADRIGRRRLFIASLTWFSVMMLGTAFAPSVETFGALRFLAGLGFGGIPPTAIALVIEVAPRNRRNLLNAVMLSGFPIGGVLAAIAGITLLGPLGFRALFALGAIPLVTLVPLALLVLPESPAFLARKAGLRTGADAGVRSTASSGQEAAVEPAEPHGIVSVLRGRGWVTILLFGAANFCSFLLVFGLNVWLPQLMRLAGYDLGSALTFLLVLNVGGVLGGLFSASLADRWGNRWVAAALFVVAAASLALLAVQLPTALLYALVFVAGAAIIGVQIVVFGYVATHYSAAQRGTALGLGTGIGRLGAISGPLIGAALITAGFALGANVAAFAITALVGAVAVALVPRLVRTARAGAGAEPAAASGAGLPGSRASVG